MRVDQCGTSSTRRVPHFGRVLFLFLSGVRGRPVRIEEMLPRL